MRKNLRNYKPKEIKIAPVLKPTKEEFNDFNKYIQIVCNKYYKDYGFVKVNLVCFLYSFFRLSRHLHGKH